MSGILSPSPIFQAFAPTGGFLVGGQLFTYQAGTTAPIASYTDATLTQTNTNPVILNAYGQANVWLNPGFAYKYVLKDSQGNTLYTEDNINAPLPSVLYPQSQAEITAGITPTNTGLPWGAVRRYGADPLGNTDSAPAWAAAASCNSLIYDDYPGGGVYIFNSQVVLSQFPLTIQGQVKSLGNLPTGGTRITLQAAAGPSAAIFNTTSQFRGLNIDSISFQWANPSLGQFGIRCQSDVTGFVISNNSFVNSVGGIPGVTGIEFQGASQFTGAGAIRDNYFAALLTAIQLGGICTTVKIRDNEIYGNLAASLNGVQLSTACFGTSVIGNTFEGWTVGIQNAGTGIIQIGNYFEGNSTADFQWSAGNPQNNLSIGDKYIGSASPVALIPAANGSTGNVVLGGSFGEFVDSTNFSAYRGFNELGLTANLGYFTSVAPTVTANGGGSVTITTNTTFGFSRIGGLMIVQFDLSMNLTGGTTTVIQMTIPQGLSCVGTNSNTCQILSGGSTQSGLAVATGTTISISPIIGGNWTAGAIQVNGSLPIRIIS